MEQPRKELYKRLNSEGAYSKSYEEFEQQFSAPEKQEALYQKLNADGKYTKSKEEFMSRFFSEPLKKKDGTKVASTSTTQTVNTESAQKDGSLVIGEKPKFELTKEQINQSINKKPQIGTKKSEETLKKVIQREAESEEFQAKVNQKLANYRQSTKVLPQERAEVLDELNAKKEKKGFLNGLQSGLKEGWNAFVDVIGVGGSEETKNTWKADLDPFADERKEALQYFAENKIKPTPEQVQAKVDELFINKKLIAKKQEKINKYLGDLDTNEKIYLQADAQERFSSIPQERKEISDRIAMNEKTFLQLLEESKKPMTPEDKSLVESELVKIGKYLDEDYKAVNKLTKNLGTAQEELDMFKRNYKAIDNVANRIATSIADGGIQFVEGLEYLGTLGGNIGSKEKNAEVLKQAGTVKEKIQESRQKFRPDSEEITLDNFGQYAVDLLANQSGTLLTMIGAGQTGGATILGLGQAGQTYSEMYKENKKGAKYSPAQMAFAPFVSGVSTGFLSASPTYETLRNARNVWKSMLKNEATKELTNQAVRKTSTSILKQVGKDIVKEDATEWVDNTIQNAVKRDILGDKSVGYFDGSWKLLKDTTLLTGMLNIGALPQVTMSAVKMFTPSELNKVLDSNGAKIIELSKQLDNINLDDNTKKLVENQISELTKSSTKIIDNTMKKIDGLTEDEVKKVVQYESKKEKVANQAQEVKENPELNDQTKKVILEGLSNEYKNAVEKSNEIVNAEIQKPTIQEEQITQPQAKVQKAEQEVLNLPSVNESVNIELKSIGIKGRLLDEKQSADLQSEIESNYNVGVSEKMFGGKNNDIRQNVFNYDNPIAEKTSNGVNLRIAEGLIRDGEKTYLLYADGKVAGEFYSVKDAKAVIKYIEDRLIKPKELQGNASKTTRDSSTNGNVRPATEQVGEVAITEKPTTEVAEAKVVESAVEPIASKADSKVKKYKLSTNGQAFNVERKNGVLQVTNSQGKPVSKPTERAVLRKHADSIDFTQGKKASESEMFSPSEESISEQIIELSENPAEIAAEIEYLSYKDPREMSVAERKSYKEQIIADEMTAIKEEGFFEQNDINNLENVEKTRKAYFSEEGRSIDELAKEMSEQAGITIEPSDIADFITKYPLGKKERLKNFKDEMSQEQIAKSNKVEDLKKKFTQITGLEAKKEFLLKAIEQSNRKSELNSVLDQMTDEEFAELDKTINQIEQETYGKNEQAPKGDNQSKGDKISGEKSGIQKEPTQKEEVKKNFEMTRDEYNNQRKRIDDLLINAQRMKYEYGNLDKAIKEKASQEKIDRWIEFGNINKGQFVFTYDAMIKYEVNQGNIIPKEVFESNPELVKQAKISLENGDFIKRIEQGKATKENAIQIIENAGLKVPNSILEIPNSKIEKEPARKEEVVEFDINDVAEFLNQKFKNVSKDDKKLSDKVRGLKIDLRKLSDGGLQSNPLGLPVAIWNTSMDIIAVSIDAGVEISEAIKRGLNYIKKNHRGQWNKKQFNDEVLKELGVRGIEINGQDVIVKPQTKEDAKIVDGFYSDIEKSLIDTKKDNLTASEWESIIGKSDEAKWTGLTDFLNSKKGKISKAEIKEYLNKNRIEIVEVVKDENAKSNELKRFDEIIATLNSRGYDVEVEDYATSDMRIRPVDDGTTFLEDQNGGFTNEELISDGYVLKETHDEDVKLFEEARKLSFTIKRRYERDDYVSGTKFSEYQLEGEKENYKEVLVTLPNKEAIAENKIEEERRKAGVMDNFNFETMGYNDTRNVPKFKSSHFDEPNILVHLRMNTRIDADGKKVLFLEEVQSDWGQEGKKEGFDNKQLEKKRNELLEESYQIERKESDNIITKKVANTGRVSDYEVSYKDESLRDKLAKRKSAIQKEIDEINKKTGVTPEAPFVTDTNSWAKLGVKVALKEAVKQGVDKIAWTTGEQQNERYDLSKQVDEITYKKLDNGDYRIVVYKDGNALQRQDLKEKELESNFGKDVAEKIISNKGEKNQLTGVKSLSGVNLSVGGKGMKGFYGSTKEGKLGIIGEVVKALTKQEPKTTIINVNKYITSKSEAEKRFKKGESLYVETTDKGEYEVNSLIDIDDAFSDGSKIFSENELSEGSKQHSIDITPELKSEVEKGLPMFGNLKAQQKAMVNAEVDRIAQKVKDFMPSSKNRDANLRTQGISQDQLIDLIASAVKNLINAGIDINEAISQVVASVKERFGIEVSTEDVKKVIISEVEEKPQALQPKGKPSASKDSRREKSSEEIAQELGVSHDDYLDLKDFVANEPKSGLFNEYLSAETIADVFGDKPTNDQNYEQLVLTNAIQHGNNVLEKAKNIFGEDYIAKTLEFLQNAKLGNFEKAVVYAALENEIDTLVKANPKNVPLKAIRELIYADSQANLRNSSKGINAGRLRRIHNAIKNGYDIDKLTSGLISPKQEEAKQALKDAVPTGENLNKASEQEENAEVKTYTQEEFDAELKKAIQEARSKNRGDLSKKGKEIADKIRRLKLNKDVAKADLSLGAYDLAIETIAQLVEKGATVAQAIKNVLADAKFKDVDADKLRQDILGVIKTPKIRDIVKQALIDAGFSREITVTKNQKDIDGNDVLDANGKKVKVKEKKEVLDWVKLTGRMNSVEALRKNVEDKLKEQGYTDSQISEISNELEAEYIRLTEDIADKAMADLERKNQITPTPNRKSDLDRLVEYHSKGLFAEDAKQYERLINKIVGISKREQDVLDKIEAEIEKIKNLREVKIDGKLPDAKSIDTQVSQIAKNIRNIITWANLKNSPISLKVWTVIADIAGISRAAVLGNLYNAAQNIYANKRASFLAKAKYKLKGYSTPELNSALNEFKNVVMQDVLVNRGVDFGDSVSPFSNHSIFIEKLKDYIMNKTKGSKQKALMAVLNTFEGRLFLNIMDSRYKSKIVNIDFIMNAVDVLTSEREGKQKMTKKEAVEFVSNALTGVNLEKAKVLAKKFIKDVNAKEEGTLIDNDYNVNRLAFDIMRENLTSGNNFTMEEINDLYQAAMKSGGLNIGHESNNLVSKYVKLQNNDLDKQTQDAIKDKNYQKASLYTFYSMIYKNFINPYVGGGMNWAIIEGEAGTPLGIATGLNKMRQNNEIDMLTDVGKKRLKEDLANKRDAESKLFRGIWGTMVGITTFLTYQGIKALSVAGDDDEENKRLLNQYLKENPEQRKIFDKFSPEILAYSLAVSDERLAKWLLNKLGYKTDQNDNVLTLIKSLQDKNSSSLGTLGVLVGQTFSTPGSWRIIRDTQRLSRELKGEPMNQTQYKVTSFLNGYFKGAFIDYIGKRPGVNYDLENVKKDVRNEKTKFTKETNGIANDITSGKITIPEAVKIINEKYAGKPELIKKAEKVAVNAIKDQKVREGLKDADAWYMEFYNERETFAKAYILYQNVYKNKDFKKDAEFIKNLDLATTGMSQEKQAEIAEWIIQFKDVEESKKDK